MRDFSRRSTEAELMDDPGVDLATFKGCLADLAKVNVVTLARVPTLGFLGCLRRAGRLDIGRPIEIVDAGSGYGDTLAGIAAWARRRGVAVRLTGVDLNPWSAQIAAAAHPKLADWVTADVFDYDGPADIVVSSLFTHHLDDDNAARFLKWMEARAGIGWMVNDLHRHPFPFYGFGLLASLMRWHRFVRHDGPVSIARAFTAADWRALIARAGLDGADVQVRWRFPFRLCLTRIKP
jgi:SAM-dependent methyltransferase